MTYIVLCMLFYFKINKLINKDMVATGYWEGSSEQI